MCRPLRSAVSESAPSWNTSIDPLRALPKRCPTAAAYAVLDQVKYLAQRTLATATYVEFLTAMINAHLLRVLCCEPDKDDAACEIASFKEVQFRSTMQKDYHVRYGFCSPPPLSAENPLGDRSNPLVRDGPDPGQYPMGIIAEKTSSLNS
jgi:hypothetical protein